jgi:heptosyltransferase-2
MSGRILVIRGGAIGDFILTLPALRLLRDGFPETELEVLGYRHIAALAEGRGYARRVRSIEYGPLAPFFARNAPLSDELATYFASFGQVISYLFDPDGIFETNLRRAGVKHLLRGPSRPDASAHAAVQLARPLEALALYLEDPAARVFPSEADRAFAAEFLSGERWIAVHPGSGGEGKNWPVERWAWLGERLLGRGDGAGLLVVGGEADGARLEALREVWAGERVRWALGLELPRLAAVLAGCSLFVGHDSGISHLAAAAGAQCVLLFGPTDPAVWAPANAGVTVVRAPGGAMEALDRETVLAAVRDRV